MAINPNAATRFDDDMEFSREDMRELADRKKSAEEIFKENEDFVLRTFNIREKIKETGNYLSEKEQEKYLKRIGELEMKRDNKGLQKLDKEINEVIAETQKLTREYFSKLDTNRELFGLDPRRKIDALQEYKDDFLKQNIERKEKYLEALPDELESLHVLRERLIKLVGDSRLHIEEFGKLRRHEKRDDYLPRLESNMKQFNNLMRKLASSSEYSRKEIDTMEIRFKESSLTDQEKLLREWGFEGRRGSEVKEVAESFTELKEDFDKFSKQRQSKHSREFAEVKTKKAKSEIISRMRNELKEEYMDKVERSRYFSPAEKNLALASVSRPDFDIRFIEECLKSFDACERQVKELAKAYEKAPKEIKDQYNFWGSDYNKKREITAEVREHIRVMKELEEKIKQLAEKGIVAKKTIDEDREYIREWRRKTGKLSLEEKKKFLSDSSLNVSFRKQVLEQFRSMPEECRKRFEKQFMKGNLRERIKILIEIKREVNEIAEIRKKINAKVQDFEKRKLIARKTAAAYFEWIKGLSLKDLRRYYEKSELDDPLRKKALKTFESLDEKTRRKNQHFYELNLDGRMALLRKLAPEETKQITAQAEAERKAEEKVIDFEKGAKIQALRKAAKKFEEEGDTKSETEIHRQILEIDPKNKKGRERLDSLERKQNPLTNMLIDKIIGGNSKLAQQFEGLRILEVFEYMIKRSEHYEGARKVKERSAGFSDRRTQRLNKTLFEYTNGEKILDDEGMAADIETLDIDKIQEGSDRNLLERYINLFRTERPDTDRSPEKYRRFTAKKRDGRELHRQEIKEEKDRFIEKIKTGIARANPGSRLKIEDEDIINAADRRSRLKNLNLD